MNGMLESFLREKRIQNLSEKTVQNYKEILAPFCRSCGCAILDLTLDTVYRYFENVHSRNISKATYATYVRSIKIFLRFCAERVQVQYDYTRIKVPKSPKKTVYVYSDEELEDLFSAVSYPDKTIEKRNLAVIALMLDSGLRQAEVCDLLISNLRLDEGYLIVEGKGSKQRYVPVGSYSSSLIRSYLAVRPESPCGFLFLSRRGERLTANAVKLMVSRLGKKLSFSLSSHKLRHNFATNYCLDSYNQSGQIDIYRLMHILGHEDIETTQLYLHFAYSILAAKSSISHLDGIFSQTPSP